MTESKRRVSGFVPRFRSWLYGGVRVPKVRHFSRVTPTDTVPDESLNPEAYRWFRRDELVRRCIVINASFASMAAGFETELEPVEKLPEEELEAFQEKYRFVKDYVDAVNKLVNLDQVLFVAQVKRSIYGKAGFEVISDGKGAPSWLLSLQSMKLKPDINTDTWALEGFTYDGATGKYSSEEVLYFVNLQLENDLEGVSDVEPIMPVCGSRRNLLKNDFPEITRNLWAPYAVLSADTSNMTDEEENTFLDAGEAAIKAGKSLLFNKQVEAKVVDLNINLVGLVATLDKFEETIIRAFGTPRFLINKTPENRATAYVEFEAYIDGPIKNIQRYFKRELEAQWYGRLVKLALKANGFTGEVPVRVKHNWNPIRSSDFNDLVTAAAALYAQGLGLIAEHPELQLEMLKRMGFDTSKISLEPVGDTRSKKPVSAPGTESVDDESAAA